MISRYTRKEMADIFSDKRRYGRWLEVQLGMGAELTKMGWIPRKDWLKLERAARVILKQGGIRPERVSEIEKVTRHDVIAATSAITERMGPEGRWLHFGLTSSDVVDTAFSMQLIEALDLLIVSIEKLRKTLKAKAKKYESLTTIGRSHGMFAEPTSFGLKFLGWWAEWSRNLERLKIAREGIRFGKLSGAVGASPHWSPETETRVLGRMGLKRDPVSTQVVPRDRHAEVLSVLAICGGSMERIALEIRHLQRSEVGEVREPFAKGQKGSSAMPHKRNPIGAENLTGCARLLRGFLVPTLENIALWHERDISHSAVERVVFPDAMMLLDYALDRLNGIVDGLVIDRKRVTENLHRAGPVVMSGHLLLALVKSGVERDVAYAWVQECAHRSFDEGKDLVGLLQGHPEIRKRIKVNEINKIVKFDRGLGSIRAIAQAAFKSYS